MAAILITGGAGFIGSHLARRLLDRGEEVLIIDDFNNRYDPRLKEARLKHFFQDPPLPVVIRGDIRDAALVRHLFQEHHIDRVVHLAAWAAVPLSIERPDIYVSVNVDGTVNLLEAARHYRLSNFLFASSSSVYGGRTNIPFKETDEIMHPISPYAATKVAGEAMCYTWHHLYQFPVTCLRFFTVYGPWGRPEMAVFKFAESILRGQPILMRGRNTERDFTYIDDCINGVIAALDHPSPYSIYNLGESDSVPLPRLIKALETALQRPATIKEVPLIAGDVPRTLADISLARQQLGYQPATAIEAGIKLFIDWYQSWYLPHFLPDLKN